MSAPLFDVEALLADRGVQVVVSCGTGGVGKTSLSAAMALRAADAGRKVVLVTVDPAKRLATALGLDTLGAEPEPVEVSGSGSLDALMLDMTATFDAAVRSHAPTGQVEAVLRNPFYKALSTSFAGTQDYMACEKLGQLHEEATRTGRWNLIVVDTPPSRSALDFLDAPARLDRLVDSPVMRVLAPRSGPLKLLNAGLSQVTSVISRVLGSQALTDLQMFASAFEMVMSGLRGRAERVRRLLASPASAFVVVASPRAAALTEARFFIDRLRDAYATEAGGVVVNRLSPPVPLSPVDQQRLRADQAAYGWWVGTWDRYRAQQRAVLGLIGRGVAVTVVPVVPREITDLGAVRELGALVVAGALLAEEDDAPVLDV